MKKFLKILISLILILILLSIIGFALAVTLINPNDYKERISTYVYEKTGRQLTIGGNIEYKFFPWIGFSVQNIKLNNSQNFQPQTTSPFINIGEADVSIKLLPLLLRTLEIDNLTLKDVNLFLVRNKEGVTNWKDLTSHTAAKSSSHPLEIKITDLNISNGNLLWNDEQDGRHVMLQHGELTAHDMGWNKSFPLYSTFQLDSDKPKLSGKFSLKSTINVDPTSKKYRLDDLNLSGKLLNRTEEITLAATQLFADLVSQTLTVSNVTFSKGPLNIKGDIQAQQILTQPQFKGFARIQELNVRELLKLLNQDINTNDPAVLQHVSLNTDFEGSDHTLTLNALAAKFDDSSIQGNLKIVDFLTKTFNFDLHVDQLNADRYLPAAQEPDTSINEVSSNNSPKLKPSSTFVALRQITAQGNLQIGTLTLHKVLLSQVLARLSMGNGVLEVAPLTADVYQGNTHGQLMVDMRGDIPNYSISETLSNIQINQLLKSEHLSGTADIVTRLTMQGKGEDLLRTLNGDIQFSVKNGAYLGFNLPYEIERAYALLKKQPIPVPANHKETDFSQFTGTGVIKNGVLTNNDLLAQSPQFKITGKGTINFMTSGLDYHLLGVGLYTAMNAQGQTVQEVRQTQIPLLLRGTFSQPMITLDVETIAGTLLKEK